MIYLDSAATTFQKPAAVQRAVVQAMRTMSSPGRGGYAAAQQAEELLFRCRSAAAELFSVPSSEPPARMMSPTPSPSMMPPKIAASPPAATHNPDNWRV